MNIRIAKFKKIELKNKVESRKLKRHKDDSKIN